MTYRVQVTMGCGWQSFGSGLSARDAADRVADARRTGYRARVIDSTGEIVSPYYDRAGILRMVTVP